MLLQNQKRIFFVPPIGILPLLEAPIAFQAHLLETNSKISQKKPRTSSYPNARDTYVILLHRQLPLHSRTNALSVFLN